MNTTVEIKPAKEVTGDCPVKGFDKTAAVPSNLNSLPLPPKVEGGLPVIGRGLELMKNPLDFILKYEKKLGDCFRFKVANREYFVMSNVEASEFAARQGRDFLKSGSLWADLMQEWDAPNAIVGIDGPKHTEMRRLYKPKMSKDIIISQHKEIEEITKKVIGSLTTGQEKSVRDLTRYLVNNLVSFSINGERTILDEEFIQEIIDWQRQTFNMLVLKKWPKFLKYRPGYKQMEKKIWNYVDKIQNERRREPTSDFVSFMIKAKGESPDLLTEGDVNFSTLLPLFGGADTVGTTAAFLIHELCFNPTVRERVTKAVDAAVKNNNGEIPEPEFLKNNVPELNGICMEILRLYPTAFSIGRTATQDFAFKGYRIPKGSEILIMTTAAHFDDRFYKDPLKLDIDRYEAPREEHKARYVFLPYGVGTHVCLGAGFSELLFLTVAATLIYYFDFEVANPNKQYKKIFDPSIGLEKAFKIRMKGWRH